MKYDGLITVFMVLLLIACGVRITHIGLEYVRKKSTCRSKCAKEGASMTYLDKCYCVRLEK